MSDIRIGIDASAAKIGAKEYADSAKLVSNVATGLADMIEQINKTTQRNVSQTSRGLNDMGQSLNKASKSVDNAGKKSALAGKNTDGAAKAIRNLASSAALAIGPLSGIGARFQALSAITSRSGLFMAGFIGTLVGAGGLVSAAVRSADALDKMIKRADALQISLRDLQFAQFVGARTGVKDAEGSIAVLLKRIGELETGSGQAQRAFDLLGLSVQDVAGLGAVEALLKISTAFKDVASPARRAAIASSLFSRANQDMVRVLDLGAGGIAALSNRFEELGIEISEGTAREAEFLRDRITELGLITKTASSQILAGLFPTIESLTESLVRGAAAASNFINEFDDLDRRTSSSLKNQIESVKNAIEQLSQPTTIPNAIFTFLGELGVTNTPSEGIEKLVALLAELEEQLAKIENRTPKSFAGLDKAVGKVTRSVADYIKELNDELILSRLSTEQREIATNLIKAEEIAKKANTKATDAEKDSIVSITETLQKETLERRINIGVMDRQRERRERVSKEFVDAIEDNRKKLEKEEEETARALEAPFIRAAENIQDTFADVFSEIFRHGVTSFEDLGDKILDILADTAGEVLAANLFSGLGLGASSGTGVAGNNLGLLNLFGSAGGARGGGIPTALDLFNQTGLSNSILSDEFPLLFSSGTSAQSTGFLDGLNLGGLGTSVGTGAGIGIGTISLLRSLGLNDTLSYALGGGVGGFAGSLAFQGLPILSSTTAGLGALGGGLASGLQGGFFGAGSLLGLTGALGPTGSLVGATVPTAAQAATATAAASQISAISSASLVGAAVAYALGLYSFGSGALAGSNERSPAGIEARKIFGGPTGGYSRFGGQPFQGLSKTETFNALSEFATVDPILRAVGIGLAAFGRKKFRPVPFSTSTTAEPNEGRLSAGTPFGHINVDVGSGRLGVAESQLLTGLASIDKAIGANLTEQSDIDAVSAALQAGNFLQGALVPPKYLPFLFGHLGETRARVALNALEPGFNAGILGFNGSEQNIGPAIAKFFTARETFQDTQRGLRRDEGPVAFTKALDDLDKLLRLGTEHANHYGFSIKKINDAYAEGRASLITEGLDALNLAFLDLTGEGLAAAIRQAEELDDLLKNATALEEAGGTGAVDLANQIIRVSNERLLEQFNAPIQALLDQITGAGGGLNTASIAEQYLDSLTELETARAALEESPFSTQLRDEVAQAGQLFLSLSQQVNASGTAFADDVRFVRSFTEDLLATELPGVEGAANAVLQEAQLQAQEDANVLLGEAIEEIAGMREEMANLNQEILELRESAAATAAGTAVPA